MSGGSRVTTKEIDLNKKNKRGKQKIDYSTNIGGTNNNLDDSDYVGKVCDVNSDHKHNSWILDSGEIVDICLHKNWFAAYKQTSEIVNRCDYNSLDVKGVGNMKLRMFVSFIRNIKCWHVP